MAHKTLVDGVAYEITGGKTLIDGTAYSIKNGKTIVDGTAYEVGFGLAMVTITITGNMYASVIDQMGYVKINGKQYGRTGSETTEVIEIPVGTVITCRVVAQSDYIGEIIVNGEIVASVVGPSIANLGRAVDYDYIAAKNAVIEARYESKTVDERAYYRGVINITEE